MSWGDVWVSNAKVRPEIGEEGPRDPWVRAGIVTKDEREFVDAAQKLTGTRAGYARAVDFYLQIHSHRVGLDRSGANPAPLTFEPSGLWVGVDLTVEEAFPRFVVFAQRVRTATLERPVPKVDPAEKRRPRAIVPLRGHAPSRKSALEWAYRSTQRSVD